MDREIKFRAWDKTKNKMLFFDGIFNDRPFTERSTFSQYESIPQFHEIVVMQFTDLLDKKRRKIFEGDILSFAGNITADNTMGLDPNGYFYNDEDIHVVVWDPQQACWSLDFEESDEWKYKRDTHGLMLDHMAIEIIGNVYENPALLTEKAD